MVRALILCLSILALPFGAAMFAPAADAQVAIEDKYATSPDGVKIHYLASGSGPLVVMIHGFPDFSATWDRLTPVLNDKYRTVAIDTRGYNLSGQPKGLENYAIDKLVADVVAVVDAEGAQQANIVGHDFGAIIAWNFAFQHPDRLRNLVILSVPHPTNFVRELTSNPDQIRNSQYARNFQKEGSEKVFTAERLTGGIQDPAEKAKYVEALGRSDFTAMMNYYRANFPGGAYAPPLDGTLPEYPPVESPVLVIHGMKDQALLSAGHSGTWEHVAKDTSILMIPEANHNVHKDAPELVNATIRQWLDARN